MFVDPVAAVMFSSLEVFPLRKKRESAWVFRVWERESFLRLVVLQTVVLPSSGLVHFVGTLIAAREMALSSGGPGGFPGVMRINEGELRAGDVRTRAPGGSVPVDGFRTAADHVVALAAAVAPEKWDGPALGQWTVRSLVGHIGRALTTVVDYLSRPAIEQTVPSTADYYLLAADLVDSDAVRRRGEQAGAELGEDPAALLAQMRDRALHALAHTDDRIVTTVVGGMLLSHYLPTRTFELAVHGLDLARATGQPESVPLEAMRATVSLATELAVRRGHGETVLLALTGRGIIPSDVSVV